MNYTLRHSNSKKKRETVKSPREEAERIIIIRLFCLLHDRPERKNPTIADLVEERVKGKHKVRRNSTDEGGGFQPSN